MSYPRAVRRCVVNAEVERVLASGMFIQELEAYFMTDKGSETTAQQAFNRFATIRNQLSHPQLSLTEKIIGDFCHETEQLLETILTGLDFLINYPFLYVDHISVRYRKWTDPSFSHTFSEVIGNSSEFNAYYKVLSELVNTPAIIIIKDDEVKYLNLDPLLIYSDEGENRIPDIFMYTSWDPAKDCKYKPVWNGGSFQLKGTGQELETLNSLLKFYEFFAPGQVYQKYKDAVVKMKVPL